MPADPNFYRGFTWSDHGAAQVMFSVRRSDGSVSIAWDVIERAAADSACAGHFLARTLLAVRDGQAVSYLLT